MELSWKKNFLASWIIPADKSSHCFYLLYCNFKSSLSYLDFMFSSKVKPRLNFESDEPLTTVKSVKSVYVWAKNLRRFFPGWTDESERVLMLRKENTLTRKWERQTILILPFYAHIRTQTLLPRLLTVPHCLIQQGRMAVRWGGIKTAQWSTKLSIWLLHLLQKLKARVTGARREEKGCICG